MSYDPKQNTESVKKPIIVHGREDTTEEFSYDVTIERDTTNNKNALHVNVLGDLVYGKDFDHVSRKVLGSTVTWNLRIGGQSGTIVRQITETWTAGTPPVGDINWADTTP